MLMPNIVYCVHIWNKGEIEKRMITFKHVYKSYKNQPILNDINVEIKDGEFFVLIGSSGCGKTTMLKMINKLNTIDKGEITVDGIDVKKMPEADLPGKIGYVVQENGLFPHLTIAENVALTMKLSHFPKDKIDGRINEMLEMVNLEPMLYRDKFPSQLSGGQRQRVNVARAFASNPPIILMDEPFSALDPVTRTELQDEVFKLHNRFNKTIVFVTHDMNEAIKLADRICVIEKGHIVQCEPPEMIMKAPADSYVEEFIGKNKLWSSPEFVKAEDIMLKKPIQAPKEFKVRQALYKMGHFSVDSLLITDEGKLLGIVWLDALKNVTAYDDSIVNYISDDYISVFTDTTLKKIISTIDYNISGIIPVLDHDNKVQGFLTKGRLLSILSRQYTPEGSADERSGIIE